MILQNSIEKKLSHARTQLLLNHPFFGALCLRLKLVPGSVQTMATDGQRILYNPGFVESVSAAVLRTLLAHEVMHCALAHHCRRGNRDLRTWNEAADFAINPILTKNGMELWEGALVDPQYDHLSAEEIYARLHKSGGSGGGSEQQSNSGCGSANDCQTSAGTESASGPNPPKVSAGCDGHDEPSPGEFGAVLDATDPEGHPASQAEITRQQIEWSTATEQALNTARASGHTPLDVERPVRESRQSLQDWRAILRAFVSATTASNYRWSPPNRRHIGAGLYLPSIERTGVGRIVIGVDTSGSIGERELAQFAGEITAISEETQPEAIHVVYCDASVKSVQEFGPSEPIGLQPKGGGGTDFRPVFQWVEENDIEPACLLYLTDLYCNSYPDVPHYPVLWVTNSHKNAPFGETVRIVVD